MTSAVNSYVRDKRYHWQDPKVYDSYTHLEIKGAFTPKGAKVGCAHELSVYGFEPESGQFASTLSDYLVHDEQGSVKTHKIRGEDLPVYDVPNGIGYHRKRWSEPTWGGAV